MIMTAFLLYILASVIIDCVNCADCDLCCIDVDVSDSMRRPSYAFLELLGYVSSLSGVIDR